MIVTRCDWCGHTLGDDDDSVVLSAKYVPPPSEDAVDRIARRQHPIDGYVGHYHTDPCWDEMHARVELVHEVGQMLATRPTITGQAVGARRRKHHGRAED